MSRINNKLPSRYWVIIPAAGVGSRMRADRPKQYLRVAGKTVLEHSLRCFRDVPDLAGIVLALSPGDPYWQDLQLSGRYDIRCVEGGAERCHSVMNALNAIWDLAQESDWVLVHDAARPCVRSEDLEKLIMETVAQNTGGILATPVRDTMKRSRDGHIVETVDRQNLWHALTPQMFPFELLYSALQQALQDGFLVTDEASAVEHAGKPVMVVEGHSDNIKITHPEDLALAEFFLRQQGRTGK